MSERLGVATKVNAVAMRRFSTPVPMRLVSTSESCGWAPEFVRIFFGEMVPVTARAQGLVRMDLAEVAR